MNDVEIKLSATLTTSRIQNLVDGVFATAMTLMLFNLSIPADLPSETLEQAFINLWPQFFTFFLSMLVLGGFWVGHHNESHWIKHSDRTYLWINIFFISFIVLIPFSTAIVRSYYDQQFAVVIYGLNLLICGLILFWHWSYATANHRLVDPTLPDEIIRAMRRRILLPLILGMFVLLFTFVSPIASLLMYAGLFILGVFPTTTDKLVSVFRK